MATLLSQTVIALQTINGTIVSDEIVLSAGCQSGRISFPNLNPAALTDDTKSLKVDAEFSVDGVTWRHDCGSGMWTGNPDATPPGPIETSVRPQFAGARVRFIVQGSGVSTDMLAEVFG